MSCRASTGPVASCKGRYLVLALVLEWAGGTRHTLGRGQRDGVWYVSGRKEHQALGSEIPSRSIVSSVIPVSSRWSAYLFRRRMMRSGVLASSMALLGTLCLTSLAIDFSDCEGMLVDPPWGTPGSAAGSDIVTVNFRGIIDGFQSFFNTRSVEIRGVVVLRQDERRPRSNGASPLSPFRHGPLITWRSFPKVYSTHRLWAYGSFLRTYNFAKV